MAGCINLKLKLKLKLTGLTHIECPPLYCVTVFVLLLSGEGYDIASMLYRIPFHVNEIKCV